MQFDISKREVNIKNKYGKSVLNGQLGVHTLDPLTGMVSVRFIPRWYSIIKVLHSLLFCFLEDKHCTDQHKSCYTCGSGTELVISVETLETGLIIHRVKWVVDISCGSVAWPKDCYSMSDSHWYGGAELYEQVWPMNKASKKLQPYLSGDVLQDNRLYGSVMERYFLR